MIFYLLLVVAFGATLFFISSRIKKAVREAFEPETVERDEFVIVKPEGFISPVNDESAFAFEAYSKDFGADAAGNLRRAQVFVSVVETGNLAETFAQTKEKADEILSEESDSQICGMSKETLENVVSYNFYKIIGSKRHQKVYELKISVLEDFLEEYQNRVDEMLESFRLRQ